MRSKLVNIEIPSGFMNVSITKSNRLTANTNDSKNWDEMSIPLPDGKWSLHSVSGKQITITERK